MNNFNTTILKAISDYKAILRKTLSTTKCTAKIRELGIKRTCIKNIDEVGLYKIGLKIIDELRKNIDYTDSKNTNYYNGTKEFLQYLELLYSKYYLEKNQVVHIGQKSSCALISAIQLITMPKNKLTKEIINKIKQYSDIVITYGNEEQKKVLINALGSDKSLRSTILPQLHNFP